jgi:hypothetical protein
MFHSGSRQELRYDPHALLLTEDGLHQWSGISHTLECHPFSGLVHSAGELLHTP